MPKLINNIAPVKKKISFNQQIFIQHCEITNPNQSRIIQLHVILLLLYFRRWYCKDKTDLKKSAVLGRGMVERSPLKAVPLNSKYMVENWAAVLSPCGIWNKVWHGHFIKTSGNVVFDHEQKDKILQNGTKDWNEMKDFYIPHAGGPLFFSSGSVSNSL